MQPRLTSLSECPCARTVDTVGEWWSILILRDALGGLTRFDEFQTSLGIAPNMLARRLKHLTASGLFERRLYRDRPKRYEYLLTVKGRDFFPVIAAMLAWGNRYLAPEGVSLLLAGRDSGRPLAPILVDAASAMPITSDNVVLIPGPRASEQMRQRIAAQRDLRLLSPSHIE
ncbi:Transcriptional regulatory protein [Bosea sp. LC85]|uniref:winged helix-turn-helix transcriptional regulator n=1 Tax=Bosea sp. LC85 TaxID=1502851 RepID=UPI0004E31F8C|nr:helix-turn-helix domain-containing protein [Bosea sp. LC85]KFC67164.1 Transcriptional regulatory protein [Bosea sp. LC85]